MADTRVAATNTTEDSNSRGNSTAADTATKVDIAPTKAAMPSRVIVVVAEAMASEITRSSQRTCRNHVIQSAL